MGFVFSLLPDEIRSKIFSFCDTDSLVQLSGVDVKLHTAFDNDVFFKNHYSEQHPLLRPYDKLFSDLPQIHPLNCWKVVCQGFGKLSESTKLSSVFAQEAVPYFQKKHHSKIESLEKKMKAICGSYYADPSSRIDQAWRAYAEAKTTMEKIKMKIPLKMEEIRMLDCKSKPMLSDEEIRAIGLSSVDERIGSDSRIIEKSSHITQLTREIRKLHLQCSGLFLKYRAVESKRQMHEKEIEHVNKKYSNLSVSHQNFLVCKFTVAFCIEKDLFRKARLEECNEWIQKLIDNPDEKTLEALNRIRGMINALDDAQRIDIWQKLYSRCADGIMEDSWAENYFQDFLPELKIIMSEAAALNRLALARAEKFKGD